MSLVNLLRAIQSSRSALLIAGALCVGLSACGSDSDDSDTSAPISEATGARGTLIENPPRRTQSLASAIVLERLLSLANGQSVREAAGNLACGVDVHKIEYWTVDALDKPIAVSGVLMVPIGTASVCTGPRPIVLYGHGTSFGKDYDLSDIDDLNNPAFSESLLIAAMFAARGYVVVAPNYVGYDKSRDASHPYLVAQQSAKDMIDALIASRKAFGRIQAATISDSGKLFVSGYSQGGHVAMATHRALQASGQMVTASAPMSGPYAVAAFLDSVVQGRVGFSSTLFMPMLTTSFQKTYGNLYSATTDVFEDRYASGIETLLPSTSSTEDIFSSGKLPEKALFSDVTPITGDASLDTLLRKPTDRISSQGFGSPNLVRNTFRVAVARDSVANPDGAVSSSQLSNVSTAASPAHPFRVAAKTNDMRNWQPASPMLMCGGSADPTVHFDINTRTMQRYWSTLSAGRVDAFDVDSPADGVETRYAAQREGFAKAKSGLERSGGQASVDQNYHTTVAIYCTAVSRDFFDSLQ
jgi:acetyl esterase/lipase